VFEEATETPRALGAAWILVILGLALAVRILGVAANWDEPLQGDPLFYSSQARTIADGDGYTDPFAGFRASTSHESADHPPLFVTYLAAWTVLGADTTHWHRIATSLIGLGTVALVTVIGFRLGGRRVAVVSGLLAAVWPNLWYWDVDVQSEAITALAVAGFTVAGLAFLRRPTLRRLAVVGALIGVCALGRAEMLLLVPVVPMLVWAVADLSGRQRAGWMGAALAATLLVIGPWTAYNLARFDKPVLLSNGLGLVLVSSNCDTTYYGDTIGYWWFGCSVTGSTAAGNLPEDDQSVEDRRKRDVAVAYVEDHLGRTPAVATARGARFMGLWPPTASSQLAATNEGMAREVYLSAQALWLAAVGFSIAGIRVARRRGQRLSPVLGPPIAGFVTAVLIYGIIRFRAPIEPPVIALGALGAVHCFDLLRARTTPPAPARADTAPPPRRIVRRPVETQV
jgi:hypothetical protein